MERIFKALGDPVRLKIVKMLAENGEMCVCRILPALDMTQPAVSHHMAVLRIAGLVNSRKQGQWVHYSLSKERLAEAAGYFEELTKDMNEASQEKRCCG